MTTVASHRRLLKIEEVAERLRVAPVTVYRYIASGLLPAHRLGSETGPLRVDAEELDSWLDENRAPAGASTGDTGSASADGGGGRPVPSPPPHLPNREETTA